jgi:hypothetical protein
VRISSDTHGHHEWDETTLKGRAFSTERRTMSPWWLLMPTELPQGTGLA